MDVNDVFGLGVKDVIGLYRASNENGSSEIGTAHMVEHMVFRSNPQFPNGVGDTLIANGWRRGANFNTVTNYERTLYMFSPNKGTAQLDETLKALASMLTPHPFSAADWDKEKQVILAEWRNGLGVNECMNRKRTAVIRSGSRQARYAIIGTPESINNTPVQVLQDFHARWYVPNNMKLIISGDVQPVQARVLIEHYFGSLKSQPLPDRTGDYYEPKLQNGWHVKQIQDKDSGASQVALIFRLDDSTSRSNGAEGGRERLIDRFADKILTQRLRAQQPNLPKSVTNIMLRKADIGRHTVGWACLPACCPMPINKASPRCSTPAPKCCNIPLPKPKWMPTAPRCKKSSPSKKPKPRCPSRLTMCCKP